MALELEIDPNVRQGRFDIGDDGSLVQTKGVKVTTEGHPVTGQIASLMRLDGLTKRLCGLNDQFGTLDLKTPEGRQLIGKLRKVLTATQQVVSTK